ncbi:MAG TPA: DNA polymerase IV [bacterium]|nr:DNA polymerase IV [bacterium]
MMNKVILHIDMDAFFAAIEELDHPEYRGQPIIVGADPKAGAGRGVVSTCNYKAREYGIHSAMPISRAYKLCPYAVYLSPRMSRYLEISQKIQAIFHEFTPIVEPLSIDEAFLDVTGCIRLFGEPITIAQQIKERIRQQTGLTASIGIAPSKFVAKIASDLEKPDGLVFVAPEKVLDFLWGLPISKMWGVGKKTETKLRLMGVDTIGKLAKFPRDQIVKRLGKSGLHFWSLANGIDDRDVEPIHQVKSVSLENTFSQDIDDEHRIENTIFSLADNVSRILRKKRLSGKTITLKIRLEDFSTFTRSQSLGSYIDSSEVISEISMQLYRKFNRDRKKVRLLGVAVGNLESGSHQQIELFGSPAPENKKIDRIIDMVQSKFGADTIKKASLINHYSRRLGNEDDERK